MLNFVDLTIQNWEFYSGQILDTEKNFPESIQSTKEDYLRALNQEGLIAKIILFNGDFAGAGICLPFSANTVDTFEIYDTEPLDEAIYLYSIAIKEDFQGKGIGLSLLQELIKISKGQGYKIFAGHYRPNGSFRIIQKLGGKIVKKYPNWSDSGEEYLYCELEL